MEMIDNRQWYRSNLNENQIKVYQQLLDYEKKTLAFHL